MFSDNPIALATRYIKIHPEIAAAHSVNIIMIIPLYITFPVLKMNRAIALIAIRIAFIHATIVRYIAMIMFSIPRPNDWKIERSVMIIFLI